MVTVSLLEMVPVVPLSEGSARGCSSPLTKNFTPLTYVSGVTCMVRVLPLGPIDTDVNFGRTNVEALTTSTFVKLTASTPATSWMALFAVVLSVAGAL